MCTENDFDDERELDHMRESAQKHTSITMCAPIFYISNYASEAHCKASGCCLVGRIHLPNVTASAEFVTRAILNGPTLAS